MKRYLSMTIIMLLVIHPTLMTSYLYSEENILGDFDQILITMSTLGEVIPNVGGNFKVKDEGFYRYNDKEQTNLDKIYTEYTNFHYNLRYLLPENERLKIENKNMHSNAILMESSSAVLMESNKVLMSNYVLLNTSNKMLSSSNSALSSDYQTAKKELDKYNKKEETQKWIIVGSAIAAAIGTLIGGIGLAANAGR